MKESDYPPSWIGAAAVIGLAGTYLGIGLRYADRFFENTSINGIDVSGMTGQPGGSGHSRHGGRL